MTELAPCPAQPSRQPIPVPARSGLRVARLIRGERPLERAATAVRRLVGVAGAMDVECGLVLTLGAARGATNQLTIHTEGKVAADWQDDVAWSLEGIARLEAWTAAASPVPAYLAEMRTVRDLEPLPAALEEEADPRDVAATEFRHQQMLREITPHPQALVFDLADLLVGNVGRGSRRLGLIVRHRMSAAHPVEQHMVTDAIVRTWDPARGSAHDYVGRPVNLRTLWGRDSGPLPARVRAAARQHGTAIELVDLDEAAAARAWSGEPADLAGHAVPAGVAHAMLRLPAAGEAPFPGMRSEQPAVAVRPLDPKPRRAAVAVPLGRAMTAEGTWTPAALDLHTGMPRHVVVQGATGTGKSTLLAAIGAGVIAAGGGVTLLDPEGSTVTALLRQIRQERADRVSVIRHGDPELSLPLNLLAADPARLERMIGLYAEMIQRAQDPGSEGIVGPRWRRWFTLVTLATARFLGPDASLVAVAAIAADMDRVRQLARRIQESDPELSHRLMSEYGRLEGKESVDLSSWAVSKLQELLATKDVRAIFGSGPDPIDVRETMDEGRSLLVDLGAHRLGEPVGRAIGATYLLKHWAALSERRRRDMPHVIVVDEAHLFSYGPLPKLLVEARKFGVGVVVATQHLGQLSGELSDALESNTGTFVALRSGLASAQRASARLEGWPVADLTRLPDLTAAATLSCDGVLTPPFTLHLDHHDRVRRLTRRGLVGEQVAASIEERSRTAATPYRSLEPLSDRDLAQRLGGRSALSAAPEQPRPGSLDDWLARRQRRSESSATDTDQPGSVPSTSTS